MNVVVDTAGAKVRALIDQWQAAWNASDMTAMWGLATEDVHWVNVVGMHWRGKAEVQTAHQAYFDAIFKDRTCKLEEIESITALPGEALIAVVRWWFAGFRQPDGVMREASADRMTLILVPRGDSLAIAHGANVHVDAQAAAHDPIKRAA